MSIYFAVTVLSMTAWLYLWLGRSGYWRADQRLHSHDNVIGNDRSVVAIVPARDEADTIADCLRSIGNQKYEGRLALILVDDSSSDGTGDIARKCAKSETIAHKIHVVEAPQLEPEWTGKLWALNAGLDTLHALHLDPEYIWFTDADVVHDPSTLRRLISKSIETDSALVSLMVRLSARRFWERWLIPAFVYFFQLLYPFPAVNDPRSKMAGAAGGCILVRKDVLDRIGGLTNIRGRIIDDCALAKEVKQAGFRIWLGLSEHSQSIRPYKFSDLWRMVSRTAFTQLNCSFFYLVGAILGLTVLFIVPPAAAIFLPWQGVTGPALLGFLAWTLMTALYVPTLSYYRRPGYEAVGLPVVAVLYMAMTFASAIDHWRGRTGRWKGRHYAGRARD